MANVSAPEYHSYHNSVKSIIVGGVTDTVPEGIVDGERYLYTFKKKMVEDNGLVTTSTDKYTFVKAFALGGKVYFLSDVYGIWYADLVDNGEGRLIPGEVKVTDEVQAGSFYCFHQEDENTVYAFGDKVVKFTLAEGEVTVTVEAEAKPFSFISAVYPLSEGKYVVGTYESGIYVYENGEFTNTNVTIGRVTSFASSAGKIYASFEYKGIMQTADLKNAAEWEQTNVEGKIVSGLYETKAGIFATIYLGGVWHLNATGEFEKTNLVSKKFNFVSETSERDGKPAEIYTGGWATSLYKWSTDNNKFVEVLPYGGYQYTAAVEKDDLEMDVYDMYFLGTQLQIMENDEFIKEVPLTQGYVELAEVDASDEEHPHNKFIFLFAKNGGIQYYDRNYFIKDGVEIRTYSVTEGATEEDEVTVDYWVEEFLEGDRVVVRESPVGKSVEYGLRNNYLVVTDCNGEVSASVAIDDETVSAESTWSSEKIDEIKTTAENALSLATEVENTIDGKIDAKMTDVDARIDDLEADLKTSVEEMVYYYTSPVASDKNGLKTLETSDRLRIGSDITTDEILTVSSGDKTLFLDGENTLTLAGADGGILVKGDGTVLTIIGDEGASVVTADGHDSYALAVNSGAKAIIAGGTWAAGSDTTGQGNSCIYASGGDIEIHDGYFKTAKPYKDKYYVLNLNNTAGGSIKCFGGKFENFDPAVGDDKLGGSFVAEGYTSVKVSDSPVVYAVVPEEDVVK